MGEASDEENTWWAAGGDAHRGRIGESDGGVVFYGWRNDVDPSQPSREGADLVSSYCHIASCRWMQGEGPGTPLPSQVRRRSKARRYRGGEAGSDGRF